MAINITSRAVERQIQFKGAVNITSRAVERQIQFKRAVNITSLAVEHQIPFPPLCVHAEGSSLRGCQREAGAWARPGDGTIKTIGEPSRPTCHRPGDGTIMTIEEPSRPTCHSADTKLQAPVYCDILPPATDVIGYAIHRSRKIVGERSFSLVVI